MWVNHVSSQDKFGVGVSELFHQKIKNKIKKKINQIRIVTNMSSGTEVHFSVTVALLTCP